MATLLTPTDAAVLKDELTRQRRQLPWVPVEQD